MTLMNLLLTVAIIGLSGNAAHAASEYWKGANNGTWNTAGNWQTAIPDATYDLTIRGPGNAAGSLNINVDAAAAANTIRFTNTSAVTLSNTTSGADQTLTISGVGGGITTSAGAVTIGSATVNQGVNIALGASLVHMWNVGAGGLTANNAICGSSNILMKTGAGTLALTGSGTSILNSFMFVGGNVVLSSTVNVNNASGTGGTPCVGNGTAGILTINTNASLTVLSPGGGLIIGNGSANGTVNQNGGSVQLNSTTLYINSYLDTNYSGVYNIKGGSLNQSGGSIQIGTARFTPGGGTATLNQSGGQISTPGIVFGNGGIYILTGGTMTIGSGGMINFNIFSNPDSINLGGGMIGASANWHNPCSYNMTLTGSNGPVIFNPGGYTIPLAGILSGPGGLIQNGSGTLKLQGANTYSGNTTINAGMLTIDGSGTLGSSGTYAGYITNNGAFNYSSTAAQILSGGIYGTGTLIQTAGTLTLAGSQLSTLGALAVSGGSLVLSSPLTLTGGAGLYPVFPNGPLATLTITNGGCLTVSAGTWASDIRFGNGNAVAVNQNGGNFTNATASTVTIGAYSDGGAASVYNMSAGTFNGGANAFFIGLGNSDTTKGTLNQTGGTMTNINSLEIGRAAIGTYNLSGGTMAISGGIVVGAGSATGNGTFNLTGGTMMLGGNIITYSGSSIFSINLGGGMIGASANWNSSLAMNLTGTSGDVTFNPAGNTITLFGELSGVGGLTKAGTGMLILSGTNTFTGATIISNGTLMLNNATCLGLDTAVYISSGAVLDLNFFGTVSVKTLYVNGVRTRAGRHNAANTGPYITGAGTLRSLTLGGTLFRVF